VPKTPKSGAGLERNQVPLSAEITCRFRPKSGAGLLRFLHVLPPYIPSRDILRGLIGEPPREDHRVIVVVGTA
jgi:hypothetical protein